MAKVVIVVVVVSIADIGRVNKIIPRFRGSLWWRPGCMVYQLGVRNLASGDGVTLTIQTLWVLRLDHERRRVRIW
jgi:hypothetical protein